jgi:glycosyltransferase involved in cell wall biosynthesis
MTGDVAVSAPPLVSICIPSFNRSDLVEATLDSIIAQTYHAWEAIVVDDGSTDDSQLVVKTFAARDRRVRLLERHRSPKGACTCRNIAVEAARGRYLMFLDTDDLLAPFCLEQRVGVMEADETLDFAVFAMLLFEGNADSARRLWNVDTGEDDLLRVLRMDPVCQGTGTLWRKDSFMQMGMWNESLRLWQDIELHLRAFSSALNYSKRFDLPPDVYIRETGSSLSRSGYNSREKLDSRAEVARKAVEVLKEKRADLLHEARFLCSSVVLGAGASGAHDVADATRRWATSEGVFTVGDDSRLKLWLLVHRLRLSRLPLAGTVLRPLLSPFHVKTTVGQVHVGADDVGTGAVPIERVSS